MAYNFSPIDPWFKWLEEDPGAMYGGFLSGFGRNRGQGQNFLDYWKSQYGDVYGDYRSREAKRVLEGGAPYGGTSVEGSFYDYLKNFNFGNQWNAMAPWGRGERPGARGFWNVGFGK